MEKVTDLVQYKAAKKKRRGVREPTQEQIDAIIALTEKIWMEGKGKDLRDCYEMAMSRLFPHGL
jgi:hypothetical protein